MMETKTMKMVCYRSETLRTIAASNNLDQVATALRSLPGVGQPFLFFASLPSNPVFADFDLHPDWDGHGNVVNSDAAANRAMLDAMLATPPLDALTF